MASLALRICMTWMALLLIEGSVSTCEIPLNLQGTYYSVDIPPYSKITVSASGIELMDIEGGLDDVWYSCEALLQTNTTRGFTATNWVKVHVYNPDSFDHKCVILETLDPKKNLVKWKESSSFQDASELGGYCSDNSRFQGHNPSVADGDFLFKWNVSPSPCPEPFFNSSVKFQYEFNLILGGKQICENNVNVLTSDESGDLEINWATCPNVTGLYYPAVNKTLTCFGSWSDVPSDITYLLADRAATFKLNQYRCMWKDEKGPVNGFVKYHLGQATEDCSMDKEYRRSYVTFVVRDDSTSGSATLVCSTLLSILLCIRSLLP